MKRANLLAILLIGVAHAIKVGSIVILYSTHGYHGDACHVATARTQKLSAPTATQCIVS
jgi:hypothetical protein